MPRQTERTTRTAWCAAILTVTAGWTLTRASRSRYSPAMSVGRNGHARRSERTSRKGGRRDPHDGAGRGRARGQCEQGLADGDAARAEPCRRRAKPLLFRLDDVIELAHGRLTQADRDRLDTLANQWRDSVRDVG